MFNSGKYDDFVDGLCCLVQENSYELYAEDTYDDNDKPIYSSSSWLKFACLKRIIVSANFI